MLLNIFCLTCRRMLLELMRSVEVFITFNANKIHHGVRHFYELLNTLAHNVCRTFLFVWFSLLCRINERWKDSVQSTENVCYLSVFCCSTVCVGWTASRIKWSSKNPPQINASLLPLFILIRTYRGSVINEEWKYALKVYLIWKLSQVPKKHQRRQRKFCHVGEKAFI